MAVLLSLNVNPRGYVDILENCFEVLNKETGEEWMAAKRIQDVGDVL